MTTINQFTWESPENGSFRMRKGDYSIAHGVSWAFGPPEPGKRLPSEPSQLGSPTNRGPIFEFTRNHTLSDPILASFMTKLRPWCYEERRIPF